MRGSLLLDSQSVQHQVTRGTDFCQAIDQTLPPDHIAIYMSVERLVLSSQELSVMINLMSLTFTSHCSKPQPIPDPLGLIPNLR